MIQSTYCNRCGKKMDRWDMQENFTIQSPQIGYGSRYDGKRLKINFCCECLDELIDKCCISPLDDRETKEWEQLSIFDDPSESSGGGLLSTD